MEIEIKQSDLLKQCEIWEEDLYSADSMKQAIAIICLERFVPEIYAHNGEDISIKVISD